MKNCKLVFSMGAMLLLAACSKTENVPNTEMGVQLQTWASPVVNQLISWNTGTARIGEVKISAYRSANDQIEYGAQVDSSLNIFSPAKSCNISIPSVYYQRLTFKTALVPYVNQPALHMEGTYGVTPVVFASNSSTEIIAVRDTLQIDASVYSAITKLDLSQLTNGLSKTDLDAAILTNGVMIISASSNPGIFSKMMINLSTAASVTLSHE
jgi:hypothetical protein